MVIKDLQIDEEYQHVHYIFKKVGKRAAQVK